MKMKEHIHREMVNELREIAKVYHRAEQLRERIAYCVGDAFRANEKWYEDHPTQSPFFLQIKVRVLTAMREKILDEEAAAAVGGAREECMKRGNWQAYDWLLDAFDQIEIAEKSMQVRSDNYASLPSTVAGGKTKDEGAAEV